MHLPGRPFRLLPRLVVLLAGILLAPWAGAAPLSSGEVIDIAGRQRMLSQRIVNLYAQLAQDVGAGDARRQLAQAIDLFDIQLRKLKEYASQAQAEPLLTRVEASWTPFRALASGAVNQNGAAALNDAGEELLVASQRLVSHLQDHAGTQGAKTVNLAGRQRMLSQRIVKSYMLMAMGLSRASLSDDLERARHEFEGAMSELRNSRENSQEITRALAEVDRQWGVFRGSFQLKDSGEYVPLLVAMAGEKMLTLLNDITGMYARLAQVAPPSDRNRAQAAPAVGFAG